MKRRSSNSTSIAGSKRSHAAALLALGGAQREVGAARSARRGSSASQRRVGQAGGDADLHRLLVDPERPRQRRRPGLRSRLRPSRRRARSSRRRTRRRRTGRRSRRPAARRASRCGAAPPATRRRRAWPSASLMSFRPSRSRKASVTTSPAARARQRRVDQLDHLAVVGQAGEHVLVRQRPGELLAARRDRAPRGAPARARRRQSRSGNSPVSASSGWSWPSALLMERSGSQQNQPTMRPWRVEHRLDLAAGVGRLASRSAGP